MLPGKGKIDGLSTPLYGVGGANRFFSISPTFPLLLFPRVKG